MKIRNFYLFLIIKSLLVAVSFCSYLDLGLRYFINKNYKLAEYMFKQSYIHDEDSRSLLYLGNAYYINKKYTLASKCYEGFLNNYFLDDELRSLAEFMLAETLIFKSEYEKAIEILNQVNTDFLSEVLLPFFYYSKIYCYFKLGEYSSAINNVSLFKTYIKSKKLDNFYNELLPQVDFILAESWYAKGNYKKANEYYETFVDQYKAHELALYAKLRLASILEEQKKYEQASRILETIELKKDLSQPEVEFIVTYNTARLLTKQKKYLQAIKLYHQLVEKFVDKYALAYIKLELAYCYYQTGKYENTLKLLSDLPEDLDKDLKQNVMYLTGLAHYSIGNYNEAIKILTELKKKFPATKWSDDITYWLGLAYYNQKQLKLAARTLAQINKKSVYFISANIYLARCYKELKEYDLAKLVLNRLLQQKDINENLTLVVKYELAECYKLTGDYQIAIQYYDQIINSKTASSPIVILAKLAIAEIYLLTGDYPNTERILQELQTKKVAPELSSKCKILYTLSKYYNGEHEVAEKLAQSTLKSEILSQDEKKIVLSVLYNIYVKTRNFAKAIETIDKLSMLESNEDIRFSLQLRSLKLADAQGLYDIVSNKVNELQKLHKKPAALCILNFYQAKYYANYSNEKLVANVLDKFRSFSADNFKFFNKNEFIELLKLCSKYKPDLIEYISTQIVPYVHNNVLNLEGKKLVLTSAVEELYSRGMYNQTMKVLALLRKILNDVETWAYVEFMTAQICERTGKLQLAEKIYKEIITTYPKTLYAAKSYVSLINYYYAQNNNELAVECEKKLASEFPNLSFVNRYFYQKALNLIEQGKYEDAIKNILFVLNSEDKNLASEAQKVLADCYYKLGRYKEAAVEYLRVLYLYPDNTELCAEAQYRIGECAEKLKLYDEAKRAYTNSKNKYPGTLWAQEAELRLKQLR